MAHEEYGGPVFAYLVKVIGDRHAAEDVLQQVFTEIWKRGPDYDSSRANLFTWIMNMARSRAIDHLRKRVPDPRDPQDPAQEAIVDEGPSAFVDQLMSKWRLASMLGELPSDEASLLSMRFEYGMSQSEISTASGIPLGTVKTRMVRALERLREQVDADEDSPL